MQTANRDGEPVADFSSDRPLFGKLDVMGIGRTAAADEAGLMGHEAQMVAIALARRLAYDGDFRGGWLGALSLGFLRVRFLGLISVRRGVVAKLAEPRHKASFDRLAIGGRKLVLQRQHPVCPRRQGLGISELLEL